MKVEMERDNLMILPETEFERDFLIKMFPMADKNSPYKAFLKYGASSDKDSLVGLKIPSEVFIG